MIIMAGGEKRKRGKVRARNSEKNGK